MRRKLPYVTPSSVVVDLMMEAISYPETSVIIFSTTCRNISEPNRLHASYRENQKFQLQLG
jgi:hypothetical protein